MPSPPQVMSRLNLIVVILFPCAILEGRVEGSRSRGRPRRRWMDDIQDWTGMTGAVCAALARDRQG